MTHEMAEARGRVSVRPWRVGLLVDMRSAAAVRGAITNLSSVWGGIFMPIFDAGASIEQIESDARAFDVDSLYAETSEEPLTGLLEQPGWSWGGRAAHGPFGSADGGAFRQGLLPARAVLDPALDLAVPEWDESDPADLALAAIWGVPDGFGRSASIGSLFPRPSTSGGLVGAISATQLHLEARRFAGAGVDDGLFVIRPGHPEDVVAFWNLRAYGNRVIGVPAEGSADTVRLLLSGTLPGSEVSTGAKEPHRVLKVIGLEHATVDVAKLISSCAERDGLSVRSDLPLVGARFLFPGLTTPFTRSIRVDFRPTAHWVDIDLPSMRLTEDETAYPFARGCVAAEVELHTVRGQDPRLTFQVPPHRPHAALLGQHVPFMDGVDRARAGFRGPVFGLNAGAEELRLPPLYNLEVMRALFGDDTVTVEQSDVGKFQTRAAEKFGGPYSGLFNQPGVRAAVILAADLPAGAALEHLREVVKRDRGGWPDPVMERNVSPRDYAIRSVSHLFASGLFVPILRVHCSHCRVETHVSVDDLASSMRCEFCGDSYNLALSHGLAKPEWRYRLAAHLRADQIGPLLPVLASTSVLRQLVHSDDAGPLVLGFKIVLEGREVEVDIATYVMANERIAVLGEVKSGSRIDANDVANLVFLQTKLRSQGVRCLLLFATLKDRLSPDEVSVLRDAVDRATSVETSRGDRVPNLPLILTGPDLSRHYWDEEHPWRWDTSHVGLLGIAVASCERNLGLIDCTDNSDASGRMFTFRWRDYDTQP